MNATFRASARRLLGAKPQIVYHPREAAPRTGPMDGHRSASVLGWLVERSLVRPSDVTAPPAAPLADLRRVHTRGYLERVDDRAFVERVFPGIPADVDAASLIQWQRRMVGGTTLAARRAVGLRVPRPVIHLGGGLHHARAEDGAGYCLFNDVAVAIALLRGDGYEGRILVVDLDVHPGDGTRALFAEDETVFTFSVHAQHWDTEPAAADLQIALGSGVGDDEYLRVLRERLPGVVDGFKPELVFVLAGTDVAHDDPIGPWRISADGVFARDRFVVELLADVPLVWTLAGGYGPDAWRYTARTLGWLIGGRDERIRSSVDRALESYRRVRRTLTPTDLLAEEADDAGLDLRDIVADLERRRRPRWFLDAYSKYGVETALDGYGVLDKLAERGYPHVRVVFDLEHGPGQRLSVVTADDRADLLIDAVARVTPERPPWRLLWVEWLLLQNPRKEPTRPLLPGQQHPGLGVSRDVVGMLMMACERQGLDGVAFNPIHFHVAVMARGLARFFDPEDERDFDDRREAFGRRPLHEAAERLKDWSPGAMVIPVSERMKDAYPT